MRNGIQLRKRSPAARHRSAETEWRKVIAEAEQRHHDRQRAHRQDRSRERDREIIAAATRVFARYGVAKARISDIAAEAGIPTPSLYDYYQNKEELAYAIPIRRQLQFFSEFKRRSEKLDTVEEHLGHFLFMTADYARRDPDWARVFYLEIWPSVLVGEARVREVIDDHARILLGLLREGAERGEWEPDPAPYQTASIFIGSLTQLIITWLLYRHPKDLSRAARSLNERLIGLLLTRRQAPAAAGHG